MRRMMGLLAALLALECQAAEVYRLDSANTQVSIAVRLFGLPWFSARFDKLSGEFAPRRDAADSRLDVTVLTGSLDCESEHWKARLLSPDWFDAQRFPQIIYHSQHIHYGPDGGAMVDGQLTIHGYTRAAVLKVNHWDCASRTGAPGGCNFDARIHLRRSDYGLPHGFWEGGDEVEILIRGAGITGSP